jgi:hypothetical protein
MRFYIFKYLFSLQTRDYYAELKYMLIENIDTQLMNLFNIVTPELL